MRHRLEAAARVGAYAGHGWANTALDNMNEFAEVAEGAWSEAHRIADCMEFSVESAGELAAKAAELAIRETYHRHGTPGPVGWGVEQPEILPDGSIRVVIGQHAQGIVTINNADEVLVRVSGPGRSLFVGFSRDRDPIVVYEESAEPRDYARATALAAVALGIDWLDLAIRFPEELGLADSEEFDRYARSKDAGELFGAGADE